MLIFTAAVLILVMIALAFFTLLIKDKSKIKEIWFLYWMDFFIMGTILIPAYIGGITFTIVIAILSTISLLEYLNLHEGLLPFIIKAACIVFGFFVFLLAHFYDYLIVYASIPLAAGVLLIISIFTKKEKNPFLNVSSSLLGLIYVSIFYSHIIFIRKMENGFLLIFFLYVIAEINDESIPPERKLPTGTSATSLF